MPEQPLAPYGRRAKFGLQLPATPQEQMRVGRPCESDTAVQLDRFLSGELHGIESGEARDCGRFGQSTVTARQRPGTEEGIGPRQFNFGEHVREPVLYRLKPANRTPERVPLAGIVRGQGKGALR